MFAFNIFTLSVSVSIAPDSEVLASRNVERTVSECSEFAELEVAGVEPLTLDDIAFTNSYAAEEEPRYVKLGRVVAQTGGLPLIVQDIRSRSRINLF